MTPDEARAAATVAVETDLGRPVTLVVNDVLTLAVDDDGQLALPLWPVRSVASVVDADTGDDLTSQVTVRGRRLLGLRPDATVTVTFTHGWDDVGGALPVPSAVTTTIDTVQRRLLASGDWVRSETIGGYRVDYQREVGTQTPTLTAEERGLIPSHLRCRPVVADLPVGRSAPEGAVIWPSQLTRWL